MSGGAHFEVRRANEPSPVVIEVPHAGVTLDPRAAPSPPQSALDAGALFADSDVGAALLWEGIEAAGVTLIVARTSRYVLDLNTEPRLPTPYEEKLPDALREVRRRSLAGVVWRELPPAREEVERRIREVLEPYHAAVGAELTRARARHGHALLLSAHTYPDVRHPGAADVVLGTRRGASAPPALRDALAALLREAGLSVAVEEPFPGGHSLARHAGGGVQAIQVELARRLVCHAGDPRRPELDLAATERVSALLQRVVRLLAQSAPLLGGHLPSEESG